MFKAPDSRTDSLIEMRVDLPHCHVDAVCDFVVENICNGLVLEEEEDSDVVTVLFYVGHEESDRQKTQLATYVQTLVGDKMPVAPEIMSRSIARRIWEEEYRKSIVPVIVADDVAVVPPWTIDAPSTRFRILIEPKMAFGTGKHETTRSCLTVLRKCFKQDMRFLDLGCGSGILSILAAKMGASYIKAVDYDEDAVDNCRENFQINKVETPHEVLLGSIEKCSDDAPYHFVCANIIKVTILQMFDDLVALTSSPGVLVLSGLLDRDADEIAAQLKTRGLTEFDIYPDNEWRTFIVFKGV